MISDPDFGATKTYKILYAIFITTSILTSIPVLGYRLYIAWVLQRAIRARADSADSPAVTPDSEGISASRSPPRVVPRRSSSAGGLGTPPLAPNRSRRASLQGVDFGTRVLLDTYTWELSQIHRALLSSQLTVMTLIAEDVPMYDPACA